MENLKNYTKVSFLRTQCLKVSFPILFLGMIQGIYAQQETIVYRPDMSSSPFVFKDNNRDNYEKTVIEYKSAEFKTDTLDLLTSDDHVWVTKKNKPPEHVKLEVYHAHAENMIYITLENFENPPQALAVERRSKRSSAYTPVRKLTTDYVAGELAQNTEFALVGGELGENTEFTLIEKYPMPRQEDYYYRIKYISADGVTKTSLPILLEGFEKN